MRFASEFDEDQSADFWKSIPTQELAERQRVSPVNDLDELSALWPADDDPDDLLDFVLAERKEQRGLTGDDKGSFKNV